MFLDRYAARRAVLAAALVSAPVAAIAQTELPEVRVRATPQSEGAATLNLDLAPQAGSRLGLKARELPASIDLIDRETLLERGQHEVRDAVTSAVGVTFIGTGGNGMTALSMRGFTGHNAVTHLLDGTRLLVGHGTVTLAYDTWPFERIEVLRGPASVLYGVGAIGGAINYVTRQPERERRHEALAAIGSFGTGQLAWSGSGPLGAASAWRLSASHQFSDGYVERADYSRLTLSGSARLRLSDRASLTLAYDRLANDDAPYWGTPRIAGRIDERNRRLNYNVRDGTIRYDDDFLRARLDWELSEALRLRNETYYYASDRHWRNLENYTFQPATGLVRRTGYLEIFHDMTQAGNRTDLIWTERAFGRPNRLLVGFEFDRAGLTHRNNSPFPGQSDVDPFSFDPGEFGYFGSVTRRGAISTVKQLAFYAENALDLTPAWKLVLGARQEAIDLDVSNAITNQIVSRAYTPFSWRAGATWTPQRDLTFYGQLSTGVDPVATLIGLGAANAAFNLSSGRQAEVGLKHTFWGNRGDWTLALYDIVKKDLLTRDPANPTQTIQIGQQSSRGLELSLALRPDRHWTIEGSLAVLEAKFDRFDEMVAGVAVSRAGHLPPNVPETVASGWLTRDFGAGIRAGLGLRYVGRRFADNANTIVMPSYTTGDAFVSWQPDRSTTVALRVRNLNDRLYALAPYNAGNQFMLSAPRSVELSARFAF